MDKKSTAAHRRRRAVAASAAAVAAVGTALIPAGSASADNLNGPFELINQPTNLCMDLAGGYAIDFAMVRSWTCNGSDAQQWDYDPTDNSILFDHTFGNYCLAVWQGGTTEGSPVDLQQCDGSKTQQWIFSGGNPTGDGQGIPGTLMNVASGLCLNVPGQDPNPGRQLWLWNCYPNPMQTWKYFYEDA